jgi:hypothetical protein
MMLCVILAAHSTAAKFFPTWRLERPLGPNSGTACLVYMPRKAFKGRGIREKDD